MQANELRIGNWVERIGFPLKITGVKDNDVFVEANGVELEYYIFDGINPIPITEEWLLKFGFHKSNKLFYSIQAGRFFEICVCIKSGPSGCFGSVSFESTEIDKEIGYMLGKCEYIHQLQNLYFALTGEELELKNEIKEKAKD